MLNNDLASPEEDGEEARDGDIPMSPWESQRHEAPQVVAFEYLEQFIIAAVGVVLLCTFLFRMVRVDGESMVPTLGDRDFLVSSHAMYTPQHGDIVIITQPNSVAIPLIKRVIAMEGDTLDIDFEEGIVYLNGEPFEEGYIAEPTHYQPEFSFDFPITVPEGMVFAMGDNRNHSSDSRDARIGFVDARYIMGQILFRVYPLQRMGGV